MNNVLPLNVLLLASAATEEMWQASHVEWYIHTLQSLGHEVTVMNVAEDRRRLARTRLRSLPDVVVRQMWELEGDSPITGEVAGAAWCDILNIPYTGPALDTLMLLRRKHWVGALLDRFDISHPHWAMVHQPDDFALHDLWQMPGVTAVMVKPSEQHGSLGVTIAHSEVNTRKVIEKLLDETETAPFIVEEFIVGREVRAFIFDGQALPVMEPRLMTDRDWVPPVMLLDSAKPLGGNPMKWWVPAILESWQEEFIHETLRRVYRLIRGAPGPIGCDFRIPADPLRAALLIDVNAVHPAGMEFRQAVNRVGGNDRSILQTLLERARERWQTGELSY